MAKKLTAAKKAAAKKPIVKKPATKVVKLKQTGSSPDQGSSPEEGSSPAQTGSSPGESGSSPGQTGSSPTQTGSSPAESGSSPAETGSSPGESGSSPDPSFILAGAGSVGSALARSISSEIPCVVIPYLKSASAGEELRYAVRAWEKNLPECLIVIIGDREDWFSDAIEHIEVDPASPNPQMDVTAKLLLAIAEDLVPENFIWSNDDIFPLTPLFPADLELLTCNGKLPASKPGVNGTYAENKQRTLQALQDAKLPTWDYSTHTPFVFNKEKLTAVIEKFQADDKGYLISSLYYNTCFPQAVPLKVTGGKDDPYMVMVHRQDPPLELLRIAMKTRKFANVNDKGLKVVLPFLKEMFKSKSRFEK